MSSAERYSNEDFKSRLSIYCWSRQSEAIRMLKRTGLRSAVHPFGCKMSEKWRKTESPFPIKWRWMPSPLSRQRQNNVTGYLKRFQLFSWIHIVFSSLLFCCKPLYWSEVQFSTLLRFLNHLTVYNQHHCTQLVRRGWFLSYDWRMHTHHPHPPPGCLLFYKASRQTVQSQIDYAAPLHWLCCLLLSLQVCATKKYTQSETQLRNKKNQPFDSYLYLFSFAWRARESLLFVFLLFISGIICSLCINHGVPSGMCSSHCVRNSHSDLN